MHSIAILKHRGNFIISFYTVTMSVQNCQIGTNKQNLLFLKQQ